MTMSRRLTHEKYHSKIKLQKRVIKANNFTYRTTVLFTEKFFKNKKRILDIGCGVGTVDFYLAKKGHDVIGIDISKTAITAAKANAEKFNLQNKIKFFVSDFPYKHIPGKYDGVLISEVLEHLKDDNHAIKHIGKLLKPGSVIIASSPSSKAPLYRLGLLSDFDSRVGHLRRYNESDFISLFESNGFKILKIQKTEGILRNFLFTNNLGGIFIKFIRGPISDVITFVDNLTIPFFGESNYYVVAKKI